MMELSDSDIKAIAQMVWGENAGEDVSTQKMTAQTAINRLLSGRSKEFGATIPDILKKGYYAVKDNTPLYQQAVSGKFPDVSSKAKYAAMQKMIEAMVKDKDYGEAMFYFRPEEAQSLKNKLRNVGKVGVYDTYAY